MRAVKMALKGRLLSPGRLKYSRYSCAPWSQNPPFHDHFPVTHLLGSRPLGGALLRTEGLSEGVIEVGYVLGREFAGKGYMREAVTALLEHAWDALHMRRVEAHVDARNLASQKLLEALGFKREALLREAWAHPAEVSDAMIYGLLRRERAQQKG